MPKVTLNKPVTVDKKKDKPCSQQRMVSCAAVILSGMVQSDYWLKWAQKHALEPGRGDIQDNLTRVAIQMAETLESKCAANAEVSESARENQRL